MFTLLSGLPFPTQKIEELKSQVEKEMEEIKKKQQRAPGIEVDLDYLKGFVDGQNSVDDDPEFDFSVFEHEKKKESLEWNL